MNKEIEEMATVLSGCNIEHCSNAIGLGYCQCCGELEQSQKLYNAGYRKAEEVRKETAEEILQDLYKVAKKYGFVSLTADNIKETLKKCGIEVEE